MFLFLYLLPWRHAWYVMAPLFSAPFFFSSLFNIRVLACGHVSLELTIMPIPKCKERNHDLISTLFRIIFKKRLLIPFFCCWNDYNEQEVGPFLLRNVRNFRSRVRDYQYWKKNFNSKTRLIRQKNKFSEKVYC